MTVCSGPTPMRAMATQAEKGAGFIAWSTTGQPSSHAVAATSVEW